MLFFYISTLQATLKISENHKKTPTLESLFNKVADLKAPATLLKRDSDGGTPL